MTVKVEPLFLEAWFDRDRLGRAQTIEDHLHGFGRCLQDTGGD